MDVLSAVGGVFYVMYARKASRRRGTRFITKETGLDYFAGLAIAPLAQKIAKTPFAPQA